MPLSKEQWISLEKKANELRVSCIETTNTVGGGHTGGSLSCMDILTVLYYHTMKIDANNPDWEDRDRFILSKGHAGIGLVGVLADLGFKDRIDKKPLKDQLNTFNLTGSKLGVHLDSLKVEGVDASTGSLGHGLSLALGFGMAARLKGQKHNTYCILGDGESDEGSVWEAAMAIVHFKATNVIAIIDRNMCMIDGRTEDVMNLEPFADKWRAFGFNVLEIDGHNIPEIVNAFDEATNNKTDKPYLIFAKTFKGEGVDYMKDNYKWHYGALNDENYTKAIESLKLHGEERIKKAQDAK